MNRPTTCATCGIERRADDAEAWTTVLRGERLPDGGERLTVVSFCSTVCLAAWADGLCREQAA